MRVLLAESDVQIRDRLYAAFQSAGLIVDATGDGADALGILQHAQFDVAVVSAEPGGMTGHDLLRRMRQERIDTPVIVLSRVSRPDAVALLRDGADDVFRAPYDTDELVARIHALVRRARGYSTRVLEIGPVTLDMEGREVIVDGTVVPLTPKQHALLRFLMLRRGHTATKDSIMTHLYAMEDACPEAKIIDVMVCKIRQKLAEVGVTDFIQTVFGVGYAVRIAAQSEPANSNAPRRRIVA
jgi:two-component system cell cycle response regulator CtrA